MIFIINVCKERLHYYEFVRPIEDVLKNGGFESETFHYKQINDRILSRADKIIICGTSLLDNEFLNNIDKFKWIFDYFHLHNKNIDVLGICAGFQIIGSVFGSKFRKKLEIGFFGEKFTKDFLGLKKGSYEVYHLHGNCVDFTKDFEVFCGENFAQAVKFKGKNIYGVLFHPEVRQKNMILNFCKL